MQLSEKAKKIKDILLDLAFMEEKAEYLEEKMEELELELYDLLDTKSEEEEEFDFDFEEECLSDPFDFEECNWIEVDGFPYDDTCMDCDDYDACLLDFVETLLAEEE